MSSEPLPVDVYNFADLEEVGKGKYKTIYSTPEKKWAFSISHADLIAEYAGEGEAPGELMGDEDEALVDFERQRRKYLLLNPHLNAEQVKIVSIVKADGDRIKALQAPYIEGREATDEQIAVTVINAYKRTEELVLDACGRVNCLVSTIEAKSEEPSVTIVDVDQATRRGSIASEGILVPDVLVQYRENFFPACAAEGKKISATVIHELLELRKLGVTGKMLKPIPTKILILILSQSLLLTNRPRKKLVKIFKCLSDAGFTENQIGHIQPEILLKVFKHIGEKETQDKRGAGFSKLAKIIHAMQLLSLKLKLNLFRSEEFPHVLDALALTQVDKAFSARDESLNFCLLSIACQAAWGKTTSNVKWKALNALQAKLDKKDGGIDYLAEAGSLRSVLAVPRHFWQKSKLPKGLTIAAPFLDLITSDEPDSRPPGGGSPSTSRSGGGAGAAAS